MPLQMGLREEVALQCRPRGKSILRPTTERGPEEAGGCRRWALDARVLQRVRRPECGRRASRRNRGLHVARVVLLQPVRELAKQEDICKGPHRPYVNAPTVPQVLHHFGRHVWRGAADPLSVLIPNDRGESEIAQLHDGVRPEAQEVVWLHIAMDNAGVMERCDALQHLVEESLQGALGQGRQRFDGLHQGAIATLHNDVCQTRFEQRLLKLKDVLLATHHAGDLDLAPHLLATPCADPAAQVPILVQADDFRGKRRRSGHRGAPPPHGLDAGEGPPADGA
mmetsp:Transcript_108766/g.314058  ORF Transcript_108766/g.314058 Transcript_108766/m.314058 type:complete len:281 (-) Transcript_108766:254-1096(-)